MYFLDVRDWSHVEASSVRIGDDWLAFHRGGGVDGWRHFGWMDGCVDICRNYCLNKKDHVVALLAIDDDDDCVSEGGIGVGLVGPEIVLVIYYIREVSLGSLLFCVVVGSGFVHTCSSSGELLACVELCAGAGNI